MKMSSNINTKPVRDTRMNLISAKRFLSTLSVVIVVLAALNLFGKLNLTNNKAEATKTVVSSPTQVPTEPTSSLVAAEKTEVPVSATPTKNPTTTPTQALTEPVVVVTVTEEPVVEPDLSSFIAVNTGEATSALFYKVGTVCYKVPAGSILFSEHKEYTACLDEEKGSAFDLGKAGMVEVPHGITVLLKGNIPSDAPWEPVVTNSRFDSVEAGSVRVCSVTSKYESKQEPVTVYRIFVDKAEGIHSFGAGESGDCYILSEGAERAAELGLINRAYNKLKDGGTYYSIKFDVDKFQGFGWFGDKPVEYLP